MAWYGDIYLKGEQGSDIRTLAEGIEEQQDIYLKGMQKKGDRESKRKFLWGLFKNPLLDKLLAESDKKKSPKCMRKISDTLGYDLDKIDYGDPEAIEKLETPWTAGKAEDYSKELTSMQEEGDVPWWETFLGDRKQEFGTALKILPFLSDIGDSMGFELPQLFSSSPKGMPATDTNYREGGYIPKKYYGGGSVQGGTPTIAGYFSMQGKTLGGNDKQSLAEKLGRV